MSKFSKLEVDVTVDGKHHGGMSIFATAVIAQAFSIVEGNPASAAKLCFNAAGYDTDMGLVFVRDREMFEAVVGFLDLRYGEHKNTVEVLLKRMREMLDIDEGEEPDPRRN